MKNVKNINGIKVGKTYNCFDDGKIKDSRKYQVTITDIIPFNKADDELLKLWEEGLSSDWLFEKTDYFIKFKSNEYKKEPNGVFARTKDGGWFGLGNYWNSGRLDVDGSLTKISDEYLKEYEESILAKRNNKQKQLDPSSCTLQDAINYLGDDDVEVVNLRQLQKIDISDRILAEQEAVCIVRALNEKHIFDWDDGSDYKYRIGWYMNDNNFRFRDSYGYDSGSSTTTALCFKVETVANVLGRNNTNYKNICKRFMYVENNK